MVGEKAALCGMIFSYKLKRTVSPASAAKLKELYNRLQVECNCCSVCIYTPHFQTRDCFLCEVYFSNWESQL